MNRIAEIYEESTPEMRRMIEHVMRRESHRLTPDDIAQANKLPERLRETIQLPKPAIGQTETRRE